MLPGSQAGKWIWDRYGHLIPESGSIDELFRVSQVWQEMDRVVIFLLSIARRPGTDVGFLLDCLPSLVHVTSTMDHPLSSTKLLLLLYSFLPYNLLPSLSPILLILTLNCLLNLIFPSPPQTTTLVLVNPSLTLLLNLDYLLSLSNPFLYKLPKVFPQIHS